MEFNGSIGILKPRKTYTIDFHICQQLYNIIHLEETIFRSIQGGKNTVVPGSGQDHSFLVLVQLPDCNYCRCTNKIRPGGRVAFTKKNWEAGKEIFQLEDEQMKV